MMTHMGRRGNRVAPTLRQESAWEGCAPSWNAFRRARAPRRKTFPFLPRAAPPPGTPSGGQEPGCPRLHMEFPDQGDALSFPVRTQ